MLQRSARVMGAIAASTALVFLLPKTEALTNKTAFTKNEPKHATKQLEPIDTVHVAPHPQVLKLVSSNVLTRAQVAQHNSVDSIWVSYQDGVYDVTEFAKIHPGGSKIMMAAGLPIDAFWALFSIHNTQETKDLLESYRIGTLMDRDLDTSPQETVIAGRLANLFANEPERNANLQIRSSRPFNAESPYSALLSQITPNSIHFTRNHLPVPLTSGNDFRVEIDGPGVAEGFSLSVDDLKKMEKVDVEVTLQCAGNRRNEMHSVRPVKGLLWQGGAISNTVWSGVRLADVLYMAGYPRPDPRNENYNDVKHVVFDGAEGYGASIPIQKALNERGDVIIAYEMNGVDIPRDHGYPLRVIVPGHVAARSVKWVNKITLTDEESQSHWQQHDYKGFGPSHTLQDSDYSKSMSIQEMSVQSAILDPLPGDTVVLGNDNQIVVSGYAVSGGGKSIYRVDVSGDGGKSWVDATLKVPNQAPDRNWAWTKWSATVPVSAGETEIDLVCKAVDSGYNMQPDSFEGVYNARGVLSSAWQHSSIKIGNVGKDLHGDIQGSNKPQNL